MANEYYGRTQTFAAGTKAKGEHVRDELDAIVSGFNKLPAPADVLTPSTVVPYVQQAEWWASYPEDQLVPNGGSYSSYHYSRKAAAEVVLAQAEVSAATAQKVLASQYADYAVDTFVPGTTRYSAYHYTMKAADEVTQAGLYADQLEDTFVPGTTRYSAYHYSRKAAAEVLLAQQEVVNAQTEVGNAAAQVTLAAAEVTKAGNYADYAENTFVPGTTRYSSYHYSRKAAAEVTNAQAEVTKAGNYADYAENTFVPGTTRYSAYHYSRKAAAEVVNAQAQVTLAAEEVTNAQAEVTKAGNYANYAAGSFVPGTSDYSAKHWSVVSAQYAIHPQDTQIPNTTDYSAMHWALYAEQQAATIDGAIVWGGQWDAALNGTPPTPAQPTRYIVISDGTVDGKAVATNDTIIYDTVGAEWIVIPGNGTVSSVNGYLGAVVLDYGDFAGDQDIVLGSGRKITAPVGFWAPNNQGLVGYTAANITSYNIARITTGNQVQLGNSSLQGVIYSSNAPNWWDGTSTRQMIHNGGGQTIPDATITNFIKLGPGVPASDDGHIEWLGDSNAGFMRLSTSDDNGTERIEFGDYDLVDRGGNFTQWLQLQRGTALFTGDVKTTNEFRVDRNSGAGFKQVQAGSGGYYLGHWNSGAHFRLEQVSAAGAWEKTWINAYRDAGVGLYYNGSQKAATTNTGFNINGVLDVATVAATSTITSQGVISTFTYGNSHIGYGTGAAASTYLTHGTSGTFNVRTYNGTGYTTPFQVNGIGNSFFSGNVYLQDTNVLVLGNGSDLQLQHNGTHSYIDNNTGSLYLRQLNDTQNITLQVKALTSGTTYTVAQAQGNTTNPYFRTFYAGAEKTRTVSSGLQVYGTLSADTDVSSPLINGVGKDNYIWGSGSAGTTQLAASWDETTKSGFYDGDGKTNAPTATGWYWGIFASHSNVGSYGWQLVTNNSSNPQMYLRGKANGTYGSWNTVITSNLTSSSVAGNFGVGGVTPGSTFNNGKAMAFGDNDTGVRQNGDGVLELWANNQEVMQLTNTSIYSYKRHYFDAEFTVNSDRSLKKNFRRDISMEELRAKLLQVNWLLYDRVDNDTKDEFGVIAQEIRKIFPEVVHRNPATGKLAVAYERLYRYWAAVQGWREHQFDVLEERVANLEEAA